MGLWSDWSSAVGAGDAAAYPSKFFWGKFLFNLQIWVKFGHIWVKFGQIPVKFGY